MRTIDLKNIRTIPVFIEHESQTNTVWLGFQRLRSFMLQMGMGEVSLEMHTDIDRFETARTTHGWGIVGVDRYDHLKRWIGERPIINEWRGRNLMAMHWGTTVDTRYMDVTTDLTNFLKTNNFITNVVLYRRRDVTLPTIDGVTVYNTDVTPNTLLQRGIGIFDAVDAPIPVHQTPHSTFRHNLYLELNVESFDYRRMTATLHRDTHTWINGELGLHMTEPTTLGFERAFGTLLFQTGIIPTWWR